MSIDQIYRPDGQARANAVDRALSGRTHLHLLRADCRLIRTSEAVGWRGAFMTHGWINEGAVYDGRWSWLRVVAPVPRLQQNPGVVRVFAPQVPSRGVVEKCGAYISLNINPQLVDTYIQRALSEAVIRDAAGRIQGDATIMHLLQALDADVAFGSPSGPALGEAIIAAILHRLQRWNSIPEPEAGPALSIRDRRKMQDYIASRLASPIHLDDMANLLGVSVRQMCRVFPSTFGSSPHQYILDQRLERAAALLTSGTLSMDEVAERSGFADQSHMTTTFKRRRNLTPLQIRNSAR